MAHRYTFSTAEEHDLSRSLIIELRANPADPSKRTAVVQCGADLDDARIDAVLLHDHASGYIYDCTISDAMAMTADSAKAADIMLGYMAKKPTSPLPPVKPITTTIITTTPSRQKISQVAASPEPPSQHLEELP